MIALHRLYQAVVITAVFLFLSPCRSFSQAFVKADNLSEIPVDIRVGADRTDMYISIIKGKSVAIVANQTSLIKNTHLVDSLVSLGIKVKKVFSPEHGFRGDADAGEKVLTYKDSKTGLQVISLYGKKNKPQPADLKDIDIVIYDIQDVGVRFYTYISTLHYVMEACAENKKQLIVLDRPNPNGHYIDGPVLEEKYKSFVGLHPVPVVYGMTVAEYAKMINGEGWLKSKIKCDLIYILNDNYDHNKMYELPVRPSPNLPNMCAIYLYPSLALFEGTIVSVGRGTNLPFQVIGHPTLQNAKYTFTPKSNEGAKDPMYNGQVCSGYDLRDFGNVYMKNNKMLYLFWLQGTYRDTPDKTKYFNDYFNNLAGNASLKQQVIDGLSEEAIRKSWEAGLTKFKETRKKYLLYKDFN